ncbi:MAG: AraC family transcriptional regulator, partial [Opitutaceae bacterium]
MNNEKKDTSRLDRLLDELAGQIDRAIGGGDKLATRVNGLTLYRSIAPTAPNPCTYEPSLLIIPQGRKRVDLGKQSYYFGRSTFLLTSIELPIISQVSVASMKTPYLAFFLRLDMGMVREILHTEEVNLPAPLVGERGMVLGELSVELLTSCSRLLELLATPQDIPFLGKLLQREIVYRLLQGTQGDRL